MAMNALRVAAKESKVMKFILGGFIFLAVGGLVFTDINGYFRGGLPNNTVARVGDTEITLNEFDSDVRTFLQQARLTPAEAYEAGLIDAFLQARIDRVLKSQESEDLNLRVGNDVVAQELRSVFNNASRDEIEALLRARGVSESQMAMMVRNQVQTTLVENAPRGITGYMPAYFTSALARSNSETRSGVLYSFPAENLTQDIQVTDAEIQDYYDSNRAAYRIPSSRKLSIGRFNSENIDPSQITITDAEIQDYYDENIGNYTVPQKRTIAQAVAKNPDHAQEIYELALNGTTLSEATEQVTGSQSGFRAASAFEESGLPDALSQEAFADAVEADEVIAPIKTLVGWHVMKVTAIDEAQQRPLAEVRGEIEETLRQTALYDVLYDKIIQTEEMIDSGRTFDEIAKATNLDVTQTDFVEAGQAELPENLQSIIEDNPSFGEEIFALDENMASYPIETDGGYIIVGASEIRPESFEPLESVRDDIRDLIFANKVTQESSQKLDDLMAELREDKSNREGILNQYDATKVRFSNVSYDSDQPAANLILSTPLNSLQGQVNNETVYISNVNKVERPEQTDGDKPSIDYPALFASVERAYLRDQTEITINEDLLRDRYLNQ